MAQSVPPPPPPLDTAEGSTAAAETFLTEPREPTPLKSQWIVAAIALGVATDLALRRIPWNNVAFTIAVIVAGAGLLVSGFARTRSSKIMIAGAIMFALFLSWRTGDLLTAFNLASAGGLLLGAALLGRNGGIWNLSPRRIGSMGLSVLEQSVLTPVAGIDESIARFQASSKAGESSGAHSVFRGVIIASPIVLVLGALLASADAVFRSFFSGFHIGFSSLFGHLMLIGLGVTMMAALLRLASAENLNTGTPTRRSMGHIEAAVLLGSITVLFAAFAIAQLLTVLGGADDALARAGLEPKQFARQGFFQLLWVAAITLVVVMTVRVLTSESQKGRTVLKVLGLVTVALTMIIVSVAMTRIFFYIGDSGLTPKRLYAMVITIWIAVSFVLLAIRLIGYKANTAWLTPACLAAAVIILAALNLANPNRRIAEDNLSRNQQALVWHVRQGQFAGDGRAVLADNLDRLSPELGDEVAELLCGQYGNTRTGPEDDLLSYNRGRVRAEDAISRLCG